MENVVAYGLYCNEKEVKNFENQVNQEVEKHKDWKLTHIYIDYTKKIKQYGCSSFIKMLDNALKDNVNIILIKNIFQLLRTMNGIEVIVKYLKVAKLEILFLDEKMSIFDPNIELQINIASSIIQWEKMTNDSRSRAGNRHKALIDKETFEKTQNSIIYKREKRKPKCTTLEEQKKAFLEMAKKDKNCKIFGYDYIDGKYVINEQEANLIKKSCKEEKNRQANKLRSEKMKEWWQNEDNKKEMSERIKIGKENKKRMER